ncbi:MAG: hypothetical protein CV045_13285 [Cyanobacteria bacterium M5B4]|nr:MAG: hypothetical protein CV045_13285 [Cyanobacteria bacterium M5B4]
MAPRSIKNKIYLDFYVEGKRHKLHFGADDSVDNWHKASLMGYKIAADIANGSFDHSLKKYGKVAKPRYKSLIKNTIVNNQLDALDVFYKKFPIDISYRKILSKHCIKEWSNEWLVDLSYSAEYFNKLLRVLKKI